MMKRYSTNILSNLIKEINYTMTFAKGGYKKRDKIMRDILNHELVQKRGWVALDKVAFDEQPIGTKLLFVLPIDNRYRKLIVAKVTEKFTVPKDEAVYCNLEILFQKGRCCSPLPESVTMDMSMLTSLWCAMLPDDPINPPHKAGLLQWWILPLRWKIL